MVNVIALVSAKTSGVLISDWVVMTVPASEGLFSAAKLARLKNAASLPCGKHRLLTCARSAHQYNSFQKLMFLQLLYL